MAKITKEMAKDAEMYVVINFNTEAYSPIDIASASFVMPSFERALACLDEEYEEIKSEEDEESWKFDRKQGTLLRKDGNRGCYIERLFRYNR